MFGDPTLPRQRLSGYYRPGGENWSPRGDNPPAIHGACAGQQVVGRLGVKLSCQAVKLEIVVDCGGLRVFYCVFADLITEQWIKNFYLKLLQMKLLEDVFI